MFTLVPGRSQKLLVHRKAIRANDNMEGGESSLVVALANSSGTGLVSRFSKGTSRPSKSEAERVIGILEVDAVTVSYAGQYLDRSGVSVYRLKSGFR